MSNLRSQLIRLAHTLPDGSSERRELLAALTFEEMVENAGQLDQVDHSVAKLLTRAGHDDGNRSDDVVTVTKGTWPAATLKPSQTTMVLGKALGMALFMLKSGKVGGDLGAMVSSDNHILDGHHRWAATILASGNDGQVGGYKASVPGRILLRLLNLLSKGHFNVRNGKPGKGSLNQFTPANVEAMLNQFIESGIGGDFPWSAQSVQDVLKANFGDVEAGIVQMSDNVNMMSKAVPSWAPDRKQMPVVDPENVPKAVQQLNKGLIDWTAPFSD